MLVALSLLSAAPAVAATCAPRSSPYSSAVMGTSGLVSYWRLGESSGTVACDSKGLASGNLQGGVTLGRPGALTGDPDTAAGFDGSTGSVSVPHVSALNVGDRFSIEAWVKRGTIGGSANQVIASKQNGAWALMFNTSNKLVLRRSNVADVASSTVTVADTTGWHHLVATKNGTTVKLYLDGADMTGTVSNQTMADNTLPLAIGQSSSTAFLAGTIDEVALYNAPLSAVQVADHYRAGRDGVVAAGSDPVVAAAGDIACDPTDPSYNSGLGTAGGCRQRYTSDLLLAGFAAVLPLGDNQYETASYNAFLQSFDPSWGRVKTLMRPALGNHEYQTAGAAGYFDYFDGPGSPSGPAGERGKGYYSFDVGSWHLVALNSNCAKVGGCGTGSSQEQWLRADLAAHPASCTLAYWHHPRYTSGTVEGGDATFMTAFWKDLYDAGAEVVLAGHQHNYERFAPQDAKGKASTRGVRGFVVGTGGKSLHTFGKIHSNSQVRSAGTYGVLKLALHASSYDWQFMPEAGASFTDAGHQDCH
jgi:hypothetical protein